ncbi:nucleotide exchange factor GrpE [Lacrimispora sp. JR3]|uniref:nucleotide exchange factor GrpE n=1 Tax=Lacrimispora sinapis TaxID=3111456 RepID=UPI003748E924
MEEVKTDENLTEENLADEVVDTEDAVSSEKENEDTESCPEENSSETDQKEEDSAKSESAKKGFFGKKKEKNDPRDEKIEELTDRLQRSMAEFDNFRKRTEKEKAAMFEVGARDIIERILPVVDNFERGLAAIPEEEKASPFADGMEKIYKQLIKALEEAGVKPIEAVGKPFDPNFHNAVMHIEDESLGENIVSQELQKGYIYRDTVVRHSMVQVAN